MSQSEVDEVILVEDNSPDNSLQICKNLEKENSTVKLVRHPGGKNLGAAETRNLGIKTAKCKFIAFLDADDYYLPERFEVAKKILDENSEVDGVYEAIGMHFYSEEAKAKWMTLSGEKLTTISREVDHNELFELLLKNIAGSGYLHLDGLVVKKKIFDKSGYFPTHLRLHQDTAIFIQLAGVAKLLPGRLDCPVAKRGIHDENRILSNYDRRKMKYLLWRALFYWSIEKKLIRSRKSILFNRYFASILRLLNEKNEHGLKIIYVKVLLVEFILHPFLVLLALRSLFKKRRKFHFKNKMSQLF